MPEVSALSGLVPAALQSVVPVVENVAMARDTYRVRLRCPEIARQILPGQFVMVRVPGETDPLLGRPFALYDIYTEGGEPAGVDFGYLVVGKLTRLMTGWKPDDPVEIWGPLGNGFPPPDCDNLVMVAGGIGQTPFLAVAREALGLRRYGTLPRTIARTADRVTLLYGVRSADYLAGLDDFAMPGLDVQTSTDDGTAGRHGFVTELLQRRLQTDPPERVYCCGPEPMMAAVAELCAARSVRCWLSLETPMACGFGACFSCVARVRLENSEWDYRRTCVDGPVFPAESLIL
ncbi:MAG: dihydroorotate dehydrogenase electron transfer subunit [Planctomycetaceae bacterium]